MPIYEWSCQSCGSTIETLSREPRPCICGDTMRRRFSFSVKLPTPGHFNHSVGRYVSNDAEFRDALKQKSDEHSARFGTTVSYAPIDYADRKALNVTDEGLAETKQRRKDLNMAPLPSLENI